VTEELLIQRLRPQLGRARTAESPTAGPARHCCAPLRGRGWRRGGGVREEDWSSDGRIVVAGTSRAPGLFTTAVTRVDPDGTLDGSWGSEFSCVRHEDVRHIHSRDGPHEIGDRLA
jgi:Domain of unknown function (DUF5122) beta-propeller